MGHGVAAWQAFTSLCRAAVAGLVASIGFVACADVSTQPLVDGSGFHPMLPEPRSSLLPTVLIAPARGWLAGVTPRANKGLRVSVFASGLDHPRWLYALPNGDILVAETSAPAQPDDARGLKGWVMGLVMDRAGAGVPSANRITLLRATAGTQTVERSVFLEGLNSPFGMALIGNDFFVATTDAVWRFPYVDGQTRIVAQGTRLIELPAGRINHHWTRNLIASADGRTLYVTIGSNSNAGERGLAVEADRAAIWAVDVGSGTHRRVASGLRNPNGMAWEPTSGQLWTVVNERDELGNDLVPDYLTSVQEGAFYGWPYSYFGQHVDPRVAQSQPELVTSAIVPDYALGSHTAPLGLVAARGSRLTKAFEEGMFVAEHGSWNRRPPSGYQVVFVPFAAGRPTGAAPVIVVDGFLSASGEAQGRPVGLAIAGDGALLIADDVGNVVWRMVADT
jgi:glucose/arabinose dehydrogenase